MIGEDSVQQILVEASSTAGNPYFFFRDEVEKLINLPVGDAWFAVIYFDNVLLALAFVCFTYTLYLRWSNSSLWFFRMVNSSGGRFYKPNTTNIFSLVSMIYALVAIPSNTLTALTFKDIGSKSAYQWLYPLQWPITLLAVANEIHGISIFLLLEKSTATRGYLRKHTAVWVNGAFIIFYLAVFLGTAIPYVLSTYWFTEGMDAFEDFAAVLTVSGRDWQAGTGFVFDPRWLPSIGGLGVLNTYVQANKFAYQMHFAFVLIVTFIFLPVSIYYMMIIKRQIDSLGSLTSTNAHTQHARRDRNIRQSYRLIIVEMLLVLFAAAAFCVVVGRWFEGYGRNVGNTSANSALLALRLSIYPVISFVVGVTLLYRVLQGQQDQGKAGSLAQREASQNYTGTDAHKPANVRMVNFDRTLDSPRLHERVVEEEKESWLP